MIAVTTLRSNTCAPNTGMAFSTIFSCENAPLFFLAAGLVTFLAAVGVGVLGRFLLAKSALHCADSGDLKHRLALLGSWSMNDAGER